MSLIFGMINTLEDKVLLCYIIVIAPLLGLSSHNWPCFKCEAEAAASPEATASPTEATPAPGKRLLERGNPGIFVK